MEERITIEWYGHSYVRVVLPGGTRIVIDPHDGGSLNLPEYRVEADIVLVTHNHYDHNAVEMVRLAEDGAILREARGERTVRGVRIVGLRSFHDKSMGKLRGENTVYIIHAGWARIAHLGDIGHRPEGELAEALRGVEVLMLPVGGVYTIDAYEAWETVEALKPRLVVPLHFWVPRSTVPLDPLERFLSVSKARRLRLEERRLELARSSVPEKTTIAVFPMP